MSTSETVTPPRMRAGSPAPGERVGSSPAPLFPQTLAIYSASADFLTGAAIVLAAYGLQWRLLVHPRSGYPLRVAAAVGASLSLLIVLLLQREGAYRGSQGLLRIRETERALRVPAQAALVLLPVGLLLQLPMFGGVLLLALVFIPAALIAQRRCLPALARALSAAPARARVVVCADAASGPRVLAALERAPLLGLTPVGMIDGGCTSSGARVAPLGYRGRRSVPVLPGPVTPACLRALACDTLLVALPRLSSFQAAAAVEAARCAGCQVLMLSALELHDQHWTESFDLDGLSLAPRLRTFEPRPCQLGKRAFDLAGAAFLLLALAPLFLLLALLIRLDSPGPAMFSQDRVGRRERLFTLYKFRTMHRGTPPYAPSPVTPRDARITRIGRFLRQSGLDEIPQLFNVLRGEMSLVGPRPEMPLIVSRYTPEQRQRLQVPPGITGLWQLSADRAFPIHENIQYDLYYIRHRGFFLDLSILIHTALLTAGRGM